MSLVRLARESAARAGRRANPAAAAAAPAPAPPTDPFDQLVRYLPTETITLFVAAMAALATRPDGAPDWLNGWTFYWLFAGLTPLLFLALAYLKQREEEAGSGQPPAPFRPHWWPPIAAFIAFLVWALSIQGLLDAETMKGWGGLIAFGALSVSTVLSLVDRLVGLPRS